MTLTMDDLSDHADARAIDTVLVCLVDMQGRLMGKRFHVSDFLAHSHRETHGCNYLLATDLEMYTVEGYAAASWRAGYGDYVMKPDLSTLRRAAWLEATALVLCDVLDHHGAPVAHSPRAMLRRQIDRAAERGFTVKMATELEFFLFEGNADEIRKSGYVLEPVSGYNEDYNILQTSREEAVMRPLRNHLVAAGIPVENTKGEAEAGQGELNIRYADALACADNHAIAKHATKEIAYGAGMTASFMPKWHGERGGSASHIHQSLWRGDEPAFADPQADLGMSDTMRHYMAGLIAHAAESTVFFAPYVNSYKRFRKGTFAPTRTVWSVDNRTAGFRLVGEGTKGIRVECRIGGSDMNPYLGAAVQIAAGLDGIEQAMEPGDPVSGDVYAMEDVPEIPRSLPAATRALDESRFLREAFGDGVVDHYVRAAQWEQEVFDAAVTDWEIARFFERA